jgi:primosomal protein N' (replication factor Y)
MQYYEVHIADSRYRGNESLTYSFEGDLPINSVVSVPLRSVLSTGFIAAKVDCPKFAVKPIKAALSSAPLPDHCLKLAVWLQGYYARSFGEALRLFAPSVASVRSIKKPLDHPVQENLSLDAELTKQQIQAIKDVNNSATQTVLLHGDTGSGKTRVYLELAKPILEAGKSVVILTPEIALTTQLEHMIKSKLANKIYLLHSELTQSERKKTWFAILESKEPIIVLGPRSALFAPVPSLGLIIVDEAHEPAYKQEQSPRFHAIRVASALGNIAKAKVVLGSATPSVNDYYLASQKKAIVEMKLQARSNQLAQLSTEVIDLRNKKAFSKNRYVSDKLITAINEALRNKRQSLIYYNRRGSARLILCDNCGWQYLCPNCDVPVIYHADQEIVRCHICGFSDDTPKACPVCNNPDVIYTSIGTKALYEIVKKLFPAARVARFDSDNVLGERLNESYDKVHKGDIDILVGTQLLAKGLDLPLLDVVGVVSAETSLTLPDYTAEERTFQLLYQAMGRVGRHGPGKVLIQSYEPESPIILASANRDYQAFYKRVISERKQFKFPPYSYLMKFTCKRATLASAQKASEEFKANLARKGLPIEIIGPTPSFYARRGNSYYYQIVLKSKDRDVLVELAKKTPSGWTFDLDPVNLI